MILVAISLVPLAIWAYLLFGRGWFWLCGERDDSAAAAVLPRNEPDAWPSVVAIIPARDEADMIAAPSARCLGRTIPGPFRWLSLTIRARTALQPLHRTRRATRHAADRLKIVTGTGPPPGWTGKLSAMRLGLAEVETGASAA